MIEIIPGGDTITVNYQLSTPKFFGGAFYRMSFVKYRLKEVATDFGKTPKEISDIIAKFYDRPKSNTQVLTDAELNVVFDYMTQKNQIKDIAQVFAVKPAAPKAEPAKQETAPAAKAPQQQGNRPQNQNRPNQQQGNRPQNQQGNRPQNQNRPQPQAQQPAPEKAKEPERKRERRVVDTSAVQVNSQRFKR